MFSLLFLFSGSSALARSVDSSNWKSQVGKKIKALDRDFDGEFGVYVQDLSSSEVYSFKGNEFWYLSSTVKVPVAIALLQLVDQKKLKLDEKVIVEKKDYRDGAGPVNWLKPGSKVSYKYLLRQMMIYSDNAATDLIIRRVGLDRVNKVTSLFAVAREFGPITTLLDVRKKAYSEIHPGAEKLSNHSYFSIKKARTPKRRMNQLAKELKVSKKTFRTQDYSEGFNRYYAKKWNSATLFSYAELLRNLLSEKILSGSSTRVLLKVMTGIHTGKKRIWRGLKKGIIWSHKTGTQHQQACDIGIAHPEKSPTKKVLILVCTRKWKKLFRAERLMTRVAQIISRSQLFN